MTVAPQAETELVAGQIMGIIQKGPDKWQVSVQPQGSQYTKNLWTKDAALVGQLSMMIGQHQTFMCGISHWTNQQNQPVRSLWINGVGPGAGVAPQQQPQPQPMQQQPMQMPQQPAIPMQPMQPQVPQVQQMPVATMGPSSAEKEERIMREAASKVASILISHVPAEQRTLDNVLALSERLVAYYRNGLQVQPAQDGNPGYAGDPGMQGIPHDDSDIPF